MKLLFKDQWRKIKRQYINVISISLLVIVISMTYTAVQSSIRRLEEHYDTYLAEQRLEDFYFNMGEIDITYLNGHVTWELCQELDLAYECAYAFSFPNDPTYMNHLNVEINQAIKEQPDIYESLIDEYAEQFREEYNFEMEKNYVVDIVDDEYIYKFVSRTTSINQPYLVAGTLPVELNEVAIFPEFANENNIEIGDEINIRNQRYVVTGFFYKPDYLFPIMSLQTIQFDSTKQTLVLTSKETIFNLNEAVFTKYSVIGDLDLVFPDYGYESIQSNDFSLLGKNMQLVDILMPSDINFRVIALEQEVTNAESIANVFLPLFIGLLLLLLLIFMKRYVRHNRNDINTLRALGYSNREIMLSLLLYPFIISMTSFLGYLIGLQLSRMMFASYSSRYLFPKPEFTVYNDLFWYAVVIPIIVILLANCIFIWIELRPRTKTKPYVFVRLFKYVETKTILSSSVLFLVVSILILFAFTGNSMFTDFIAHTKTGNHYTEMIHLRYMTNTHDFDTYETYTKWSGKIVSVNSRTLKTVQSTTVYGIKTDTTLKVLIENDYSQNQRLESGIIISDYLHTTLDIDTGDTITFTLGESEVTTTIMGVSNELIENNFYMNQTDLNNLLRLDNTYYNGIFATDYDYESQHIISRIDYNQSVEDMGEILTVSSMIVNYLVILSWVLSIGILGLILLNYFTDKRRDIAVLKSLGYNANEIHKKYIIVIYFILIIFYVLSIPLTTHILNYLLEQIMSSIGFKLIVSIRLINIVFGFIILHIVFAFILYFATRFYQSISLSEILKKESN